MMNLIKNKYNLILGALIGFVLAQVIITEGYAVIAARQQNSVVVNWNIPNQDAVSFKLIGFIVFFASIAVFNTKRFRRINMDKISIYLILAVILSIIVTAEGMFLLGRIILKIEPNLLDYISNDYFISINAAFIAIIICIIIFLTTFLLLVNRKVKYIKFLTEEVKRIKHEGFGRTIDVKGGDELAELCRSINDMSMELGEKIENEKAIEKNKNELITNISHDLKTPLTSIVGYLELINKDGIDEKSKTEYAKIAYNKSIRLTSLVNELFEYTKLSERGLKLKRTRMNISMLLNQAVGESIMDFDEKNINVILKNPYEEVYADIDAVQMLRAFENLIKNAEKYSDCNSDFLVSLNTHDKKIEVSFMNKCSCIDDKELQRFFERFYRQDKARNKEGTGLGLAICRRIIELHDGSITAEMEGDNVKFNIILDEAY